MTTAPCPSPRIARKVVKIRRVAMNPASEKPEP